MESNSGKEAILKFLHSNVPKSHIQNIETNLKKDFVLAKIKSKVPSKKKTNKKAITLNRKEKKTIGFFNITEMSDELYKRVQLMNKLWEGYMHKTLDLNRIPDINSKSWDNFSYSMFKADFHGSHLTVVKSKCVSQVGISGICVMDTRDTFKIVSSDKIVRTIPKKQCIFDVKIERYIFTIYGLNLCVRPAERSTKKLKSQPLLE